MTQSRVAVIVASCGRAAELDRLLASLRRQTLAPSQVILAVTAPQDLPAGAEAELGAVVHFGQRGSCVQRNAGLDLVAPDTDAVAFFDDDYVPSRFAVQGIVDAFEDYPDAVGFDGVVLADGVLTGGLDADEAERLVAASDANVDPSRRPTLRFGKIGLYGCNMAFRWSRVASLRFDEELPLYGWQEDVDFARRALRPGETLGVSDALVGVHRGVKTSRSPGKRLGYSQVANPIYLMRKGTMPPMFALRHVVRNVGANVLRSVRPEPWVDRRGRLHGNLLGLRDLVIGRSAPRRAARL